MLILAAQMQQVHARSRENVAYVINVLFSRNVSAVMCGHVADCFDFIERPFGLPTNMKFLLPFQRRDNARKHQ